MQPERGFGTGLNDSLLAPWSQPLSSILPVCRSNSDDVRRTVVHIKGSSFTEHVEVARGHVDTEYNMKHLKVSPEQV